MPQLRKDQIKWLEARGSRTLKVSVIFVKVIKCNFFFANDSCWMSMKSFEVYTSSKSSQNEEYVLLEVLFTLNLMPISVFCNGVQISSEISTREVHYPITEVRSKILAQRIVTFCIMFSPKFLFQCFQLSSSKIAWEIQKSYFDLVSIQRR